MIGTEQAALDDEQASHAQARLIVALPLQRAAQRHLGYHTHSYISFATSSWRAACA